MVPDDPEGWGVEGREGRDVCITTADSGCCMAETNTTLQKLKQKFFKDSIHGPQGCRTEFSREDCTINVGSSWDSGGPKPAGMSSRQRAWLRRDPSNILQACLGLSVPERRACLVWARPTDSAYLGLSFPRATITRHHSLKQQKFLFHRVEARRPG